MNTPMFDNTPNSEDKLLTAMIGTDVKPGHPEEHARELEWERILLIVLTCLMLIFFISEALFEKYKFRMGHQTGITVIAGIIFSITMHFLT